MRARLIVNPASGRAEGSRRLSMIERRLAANGFLVETCVAVQPGEARTLASVAARDGFQMVISGGGDGTIHEVINGIAGSDLILGVLPMGTANVLAWEMGIPLDSLKACDLLARGTVRTIDLGRVSDGGYFCCMAGVGLDAQVVKELDPTVKGILGAAAYPLTGLGIMLRYGLPDLTVEIDGRAPPLTGYALVVCNSRHYGGRFILCPDAVIDDGLLDVCVLHKRDTLTILRSGLQIILSNSRRLRGIAFYRGKSVRVMSAHKVPVQSDGDLIGTTPVNFSVAPGALRIMAL
jgi:YegS/Rv2252/BmrU family lipid kinase